MSEATKQLLAEVKTFPWEVQQAIVEFINLTLSLERKPEPCELNRLFAQRIAEIREGDVGVSAALLQLTAS